MILFILSTLSLAAWSWIAFRRLPVLRPLERLLPATRLEAWPEVAAIVPARNEAASIEAIVSAHMASGYPGRLTLILVDDHSTDDTAERARRAVLTTDGNAANAKRDTDCDYLIELSDQRVFALTRAPTLEPGWTGKLSAVNAGLERVNDLAPAASYILLCDADIILKADTLEKLVAHAKAEGTALTSLMARLDNRGFWGGLLIPAFVFFFQKLYPFDRSNDANDEVAAAAGGCMLLRRDALEAIDGVSSIRDRLIDDCALASAIKKTGGKIWLGIAKDEAVSLRDNRSLGSIWKMVARTAFTQLGLNWFALIGAVIGMALLYLLAPAIALGLPVHGNELAAAIAAAAWAVMALTYLPTARIYDETPLITFALPLAALLYTAMTISSAINHALGHGGQWKGRTYSA
ncbi:MAG: glycosyltransferase [Parvularculaceae bacterium]